MTFIETFKAELIKQMAEPNLSDILLTTCLEIAKLEEKESANKTDKTLEERVKSLEAQISVLDHGKKTRRVGALGRTRTPAVPPGTGEATG